MSDPVIVYVTSANPEEARAIAETVVRERLAACANLLGPIESFYWWRGAYESGKEVALLLKTRRALLDELFARIRTLHSYECPAIVAWPIAAGFVPFLDWIVAETADELRSSGQGP